ncbi:MAG: adenine phosphoribosyltransferase [Spirochaetales bacterium]|nr:adenine phosphoribosyltransferase [Spirochaetales bacterium]
MVTDEAIDAAIRKIPDFPKAGILFYDLTSLLAAPDAFSYTVDRMVDMYADRDIRAVAAIEARGFLLAAPFAYRQNLPLILLRKAGKLPGKTLGREFSLEYGTDRIEVHSDDVPPGADILVVDDLIATGGTVEAACELIEEAGARVAGVFAVVALPFLGFAARLRGRDVRFLQEYASE